MPVGVKYFLTAYEEMVNYASMGEWLHMPIFEAPMSPLSLSLSLLLLLLLLLKIHKAIDGSFVGSGQQEIA